MNTYLLIKFYVLLFCEHRKHTKKTNMKQAKSIKKHAE